MIGNIEQIQLIKKFICLLRNNYYSKRIRYTLVTHLGIERNLGTDRQYIQNHTNMMVYD